MAGNEMRLVHLNSVAVEVTRTHQQVGASPKELDMLSLRPRSRVAESSLVLTARSREWFRRSADASFGEGMFAYLSRLAGMFYFMTAPGSEWMH